MPKLGKPEYFEQLIHDPVAVVIFNDKVLVVRADGSSIERELANGDEDYDDMPEGHGS
jgi:hypothetical protein